MNYYTSNPYFNNYTQSNYGNNTIMPPPPALNGRPVENEDIVKICEIPMGSYGVFPKIDLSEIYIKTWGANGISSIVTYKPVIPQQEQLPTTVDVLERLQTVESKIDKIIEKTQPKVEVLKNAF